MVETKTPVDAEYELFKTANLPPDETGLPFVVWISPGLAARHDIRIKVSPGPRAHPDEFITIRLRPEVEPIGATIAARDLRLLRRWVALNFDVLLDFWEGRILYSREAEARLRHVRHAPPDSTE